MVRGEVEKKCVEVGEVEILCGGELKEVCG